mmetsp:Transcript_18019/g.47597  ORF Transcript_18019/g.47597 Transcript_18019/m.47597 type:complete len:87 (-) Transcript_18019:261-521(-)
MLASRICEDHFRRVVCFVLASAFLLSLLALAPEVDENGCETTALRYWMAPAKRPILCAGISFLAGSVTRYGTEDLLNTELLWAAAM